LEKGGRVTSASLFTRKERKDKISRIASASRKDNPKNKYEGEREVLNIN